MADVALTGSATPQRASLYAGRLRRYGLSALLLATLGILIAYPLGTLVYASLVDVPPRPGEPVGNLTWDNFSALTAPGNVTAIKNSLVIGVGGTALALAIGTGLAWFGVRSDMPCRWLTYAGGLIPLFLSSFVGALAWAFLATPHVGYLNLLLRGIGLDVDVNVYNLPGIIFVTGLYHAPFAFIYMSGALSLINSDFEEAGKVHGGNTVRVARHVAFPLVRPALLSAGTITLVLTIENFPIADILGTPKNISTVPVQIFRLMTQQPSEPNAASAFGVALLVFLLLLVALQARLLRGKDYATVTGKGFRPRPVRLGAWRWPAFGLVSAYVVVAVLLPLWALAMRALSSTGFFLNASALFDLENLTLSNFVTALDDPSLQRSVRNTLLVAVGVAIAGGAFHYLVARVVQKTRLPGRRLMEAIAVSPIAIPGIVIGLGYLWAWIRLPVPIFGSLIIFVLAYSARLMPFGYRAMTSTITQVHAELEEAARLSGAGRVRATTSVTLPLMRPGILSMMLLLFIMSFHELSVSLFLVANNTEVITVYMYLQWASGNTAEVAVISLLMSAMLLAIVAVLRRTLRLREV